MSSQAYLHQAVALNNEGSNYFAMGDLRSAANKLTEALQVSKLLIARSDDEMDTSSPSSPLTTQLKLDDIMTHVGLKGSSLEPQRVVYESPIQIPSNLTFTTTPENVSTLSAAIIFNMSLTYHKLALTQTSESQRFACLNKAVKLYEFGSSLKENMVWSNYLHLALLNNLGLAHEQLGNKEKSEQCFQQLLSCILYIIDCQQGRGSITEFEMFFENTMHIIFPGCCNGAAAAA
jgi:tetratricopeptide (TPR) repeat protein